MPKRLINSRLHCQKNRQKPKIKLENNQSQLPPNLQILKQKLY